MVDKAKATPISLVKFRALVPRVRSVRSLITRSRVLRTSSRIRALAASVVVTMAPVLDPALIRTD